MHLRQSWLKTSRPEEGNRYPGTGSTQVPKQDELRPMPRHTIKKETLETSKGSEDKTALYKGIPIRRSAHFSAQTLQSESRGMVFSKFWKGKPWDTLPIKVSFRIAGGIENFPDKQKLKEFISTKPTLKEMWRVFSEWKRGIYKKEKIPLGNANT